MGAYFKITAAAVIGQGCAQGEHNYIVYENGRGEIHVNAMFRLQGGTFTCCTYYDRYLCADRKALKTLTKQQINDTAYGAFMDGAR
ncbi:hypothetical protein SAMN02910447_00479 [Ruminococcus sp. YE71]|uniref:hypothetical protein n=1 Tax=unclassified Ruminococcus TaxID=2608920 RepID=UPI00088225A4|nr:MULTISPECIES: hypothetical protein [unclassified Ruminococcus]SDA11802.1 hypothetical protein SAMN02910446_00478 [Ruminococcus sp. YE78]SFW15766.1 hypothetical protein SAMN02910447_00479 [Ruminococcus sp. YE71]